MRCGGLFAGLARLVGAVFAVTVAITVAIPVPVAAEVAVAPVFAAAFALLALRCLLATLTLRTVATVGAIISVATIIAVAAVAPIIAALIAFAPVIAVAALLEGPCLGRFDKRRLALAQFDHLRARPFFRAVIAVLAIVPLRSVAPSVAVAVAALATAIGVLTGPVALPAAAPALLLLLTLAFLLLGRHFALRFAQHAGVMFGVLQEVFGGHAIIRQLRVTGEKLVLLDDLLRGATHLALGAGAVKDAIDDVA